MPRSAAPRPPARRPNGYTLVELIGALLLLVLLGSMVLAAPRPAPGREAADVARQMRALLASALADAEVDGVDVVIRAEAAPGDGTGGRFRVILDPDGTGPGDDAPAEGLVLEGGVRWRAGTASVDPHGLPTDGRIPGTVRCTPESCETGGDHAVYFVGHERRASVAWALVLGREREIQLFRWDDATHTWRTESG